jgi:Flp pilus assembly protein TadD
MFFKRLRSLTSLLITGLAVLLCVVISPGITVPSHSVAQEVSQAEPQTLEQQGKALYDAGRFAEAVAVLQQAIQAYQIQGDSVSQAIALTNLALTYHQMGNGTQATEAINSSLTLLAASNRPERRLAEAQALDIRGQLQFS